MFKKNKIGVCPWYPLKGIEMAFLQKMEGKKKKKTEKANKESDYIM
jgi:hypothetical protein